MRIQILNSGFKELMQGRTEFNAQASPLSTTYNLLLFQLLKLQIVSMLFSTSDFKHAVCTPAMVLMSQVLAQVSKVISI